MAAGERGLEMKKIMEVLKKKTHNAFSSGYVVCYTEWDPLT